MQPLPFARIGRLSFVALTAALVLDLTPASAQPSVDAIISGSFDRVVKTAGSDTDAGSAPAGTLNAEHLALDERLRLFYALDGGTFSGDGDWHYLAQTGGARYSFGVPGDGQLFVGGTATGRLNGDSWSTANYRGVGAFGNFQWTRDTSSFRTGARVDARRFADEAALDQNEFNVFGSALKSFQTRTTIIGEVTWGAKRFTNGALLSVEPYPADAGHTDVPASAGNSPGSNNGYGNAGMGNSDNAGSQGAGAAAAARAAGQQGMWRMAMASSSTSSNAPARQLTIFGRVAQSVADRLALSFEASHRNAGGVVAPAVIETPEMLIDDGVYDDPYASDATTWRGGMKYAGAGGRLLDGGFSHWSKFYEATPALDATGTAIPGALRDDRVWRFDLNWREPIVQGRTGLVSLALVANYSFMDSSSTDAYYNYDAHRFRIGLSVAY